MPSKIIEVPGVGNVEFPGSMPDGAIAAVLKAQYGKKPEQPDPSKNLVPSGAAIQAPNKRGVGGYLQDVEYDLRKGTTATLPGRIANALGATGFDRGTTPETADRVVSPILGPLHAGQGVAEIPAHPFKGTVKTLSGLLQTAEYPLAFLGNAPGNAEAVAGKVIPSEAKNQAAQKFQQVMSVAKDNPVAVTDDLSSALSRYQELVDAGGSRSLSVSKLLKRVTDPEGGPMTYKEARDFYSNLTRLSADEFNRLTPKMQAQVAKVTQALGRSIQETATAAGQGDNLSQAMSQFRYGAQGEKVVKAALKYAIAPAAGVTGLDILARYLTSKYLKK